MEIWTNGELDSSGGNEINELCLEVLLDIRELLQQNQTLEEPTTL